MGGLRDISVDAVLIQSNVGYKLGTLSLMLATQRYATQRNAQP